MQIPFEDIRKEPLIRKKWSFKSKDITHYPDGILVTGANSFIGAHVVREAQKLLDGPVHLLLRASSEIEAVSKMKQAFAKWQLGPFPESRAMIHLGDTLQPRMGLQTTEHHQLKRDVGQIIHLAITPIYQLPYHHFKRVWVPELDRMFAFCDDRDYPKSLHYLSSIYTNLFTTNDDFKAMNSNAWLSGNTGFKWIAGKAIENAFSQGLRGSLYDIPQVMGSEEIGLCSWYNPTMRLLEIFFKTAMYCRFSFPIFPVDVLARLIIFNIREERKGNGSSFIRPMLEEPLNEQVFAKVTTGILDIRETGVEELRKILNKKMRIDLLLPPDFNDLLEKIRKLPSLSPEEFTPGRLPSTSAVFMSNLSRILSYDSSYVSPIY